MKHSSNSRKSSRHTKLEDRRERRANILGSINNRIDSSLEDRPEDIFSNGKDKTTTHRRSVSFVRDRLTDIAMDTTFLDKYEVKNLASASSRDLRGNT